MILVDSSVWIDHLHSNEPELAVALAGGQVATHALVVAELSLGNIKGREQFLAQLKLLPRLVTARDQEVLDLVESERLYGLGIGAIDAHLLASVMLSPGTRLWTRDKRLKATASKLSVPTQ